MKKIKCITLVATISFFRICGMAQNKTADSLARQADFFLDHSIISTYQPEKAFSLYVQAANLGNARAMNAVGMCCKLGLGTNINNQNAKEWYTKAANAGYLKASYNLGLSYKDANDYANAYLAFCKAAALNDAQSIYAKAYMLYKGLGCTQNYSEAAKLFAQGAYIGKSNSMYFYGLCLRNGYGITANKDSAKYWLVQASNNGYQMASDELMVKEPEKVTIAGGLAKKIKDAQKSLPQTNIANKYTRVEYSVNANDIGGSYTGYLLKYDWSGQNVIEANKLAVTLKFVKGSLSGVWAEDDSVPIPINAILTSKGLLFKGMQYSKTNHYSQKVAELSVFKQANLQLNKIGDSVYLSGNIEQFIPERNEPSKPLFIALVRTKANNSKNFAIAAELPFRAYPNPFGNIITIDFELKETCNVSTQLLSMDGKVVYNNIAGTLSPGNYALPLQTQEIAAGYYTLVLHYGDKIRTSKMIKL